MMVRLNEPLSQRIVLAAKIVAVGVWLGLVPRAWFGEIRDDFTNLLGLTHYGRIPTVYLGVVLVSFAGLSLTAFLRSTAIRVPLLVLFLLASATEWVVLGVSGSHLDTTFVRTLWRGHQAVREAVSAYRVPILSSVAAAVLLLVPLGWPFPRGLSNRFAVAPLAALLLVSGHYWVWQGLVEGYPTPLVLPARVAWILHEPQTQNDLPLKPVPLAPVAAPAYRKIVFILDESVRGDYVTINNAKTETTPFLAESADRLINFGMAIAGANCSFQSRWMLRRGVRPWQIPANDGSSGVRSVGIDEGPRTTIWQFARSAGFRTVHLDGPSSFYGRFHDGMTLAEGAFIDDRIAMKGVEWADRDLEAARTLVSILSDPEPAFVFVEKVGVHFPYDLTTPLSYNRFHRADGTRFEYAHGTHQDQVGSYENAVAWSVDEFFRAFLPKVDPRGVLILYTSDHGEHLGDADRFVQGHCTVKNTQSSEAWVPLFAVKEESEFGRRLSSSAARSPNRASHFQIFPTLLVAMGYDAAWVTTTYGSSLLDIPLGQPRRFLIGDVMGPGWRRWIDAGP